MEEALLILFGFILAFIPNWLNRKRKLKSHWHAIDAELDIVRDKANAYINSSIMAPLYRFPHSAYDSSFQMLLTEGALNRKEVFDIERFYLLIKEINRGLDQIQGYLATDNQEGIKREYTRNVLKVKELYEGNNNECALIMPVTEIVTYKCKLKLYQY